MTASHDVIPRTYAQWWHCITVDCGIGMTPVFIQQRLRRLGDTGDETTQRFIALYGTAHHRAVIGWFERAARELA